MMTEDDGDSMLVVIVDKNPGHGVLTHGMVFCDGVVLHVHTTPYRVHTTKIENLA